MPVPDKRRPAGVQPPVTSPDRIHPDAALVVGVGVAATPGHRRAASIKVVVVVGPGRVPDLELHVPAPRTTRRPARSYGAAVTEIYSPYATWSKVKAAAQGANLLIYLGHGNG